MNKKSNEYLTKFIIFTEPKDNWFSKALSIKGNCRQLH